MACLGQLVPGLLLDIQILSLPRYSRCRSNLAPIKRNSEVEGAVMVDILGERLASLRLPVVRCYPGSQSTGE
jgi:hypothetical protein